MLTVQEVEALEEARRRRGLEVGGMLASKGGPGNGGPGLLKEDLGPLREGSDGETSDYQRSTPSPRDADDMVMELNSEVADKSDCPPSPPSHWGAKAHQPDLGFVDCSDSASSSSSLPYSPSSSSPYSSQLDCHISSSLARLSSLSSSSSLLGKQLKVQLEKLPLPVVRGERKRTLLSSASSVPGKKRKSHVTAGLFNTFRISKPPPSLVQEAKINFSEQQKHRRLRDIEEPVVRTSSDDCSLVAEPGISECTNTSTSECSTPLLLASDESRGAEPDCAVERDPTDATFVLPRKLRFPVSSSSSPSGITCKWQGCLQGFKTHGKLSDHIKVVHVIGQLESSSSTYSCLWEGCKVFGKPSSSRGWVEKHVALHGGKFAFPCIVEGCRHRFSSQVMLERHVNNHFSESGSSGANHSGPRKSTESGDTARKRLKRAGVKLKFRQLPFSARIFDFFDAGNMAGIRHTVAELEERSCLGGVTGDTIQLSARVLGTRIHPDGQRWLNVRWTPNNHVADEWVSEAEFCPTRSVKLSVLPEASKALIGEQLLPRQDRRKQGRKTKRVAHNTDFLTPDELEAIKEEEEE